VSVNMPVAMPRLIVFPVPLWRVDMSLHISKRLKDLSAVAVSYDSQQNYIAHTR
jgi:hypothetical protein